MGLFGKPKAQPCDTFEEFLQQEPTSLLLNLAFSEISILYRDEGETQTFYSPRAGVALPLKLTSYYQVYEGSIIANDCKKCFTHQLPSKFKEMKNGLVLPRTIFEIVEQRGDDPNIAFFLGVDKEFGLFHTYHEKNKGMADYHYGIAEKQGCRLLPLLNHLRTATYNKDHFKDLTEFIMFALFASTKSEFNDYTAREITKGFSSSDSDILRRISTIGIIMCQEMGYPYSTLLVSNYIKNRVNGKYDELFYNSIPVLGECSNNSLVALAAKVWLQAQNGDPLAIRSCEINGTAF